jgi:5'(3')-deoxyribonucleotidase
VVQGEPDQRSELTVGIDLDGVLGDQVVDVLPRIKQRLGIELRYDDITEFRLPLGATDLSAEIREAQLDESYLRDMPAFEGSPGIVAELRRRHSVVLITARPPESLAATERWLQANGFVFDDIVNAEESKKSVHGLDVLIDDYTGNVLDFLEHTDGLALLLDRPWNRTDRTSIARWIAEGRAEVVSSLFEVPARLKEYDRVRLTDPGCPRGLPASPA